MAESNPPQKNTPIDYISDSESSDEELNQHLRTFQEERYYDTIRGPAHATQAALSYTTAQCNPTVECGPDNTKDKTTLQGKIRGQDNTDP